MHVIAFFFGLFFCLGVALDAFQTIILPRRPTRRFRITRLFYMVTWRPWAWCAARMHDQKRRDQFYSYFGPASLLLLLAVWATLLITGFGLMFFGLHTPFHDPFNGAPNAGTNLRTDLYVSGTTMVTLGLGDVTPNTNTARLMLVMECATGLFFIALVIGYIPVLYQAFSRREVSVALLDGRAGSPPTAAELIRRHGYKGGEVELIRLLAEWERWSAEILESHISYPLLCYYRSQHDNQSWLSAMVAVLDACALLITTIEGETLRQAQLTFAMARHALVDLGHVFSLEEATKAAETGPECTNRMPKEMFTRLCDDLGELHVRLCGDPAAMRRLTAIRKLYEPNAAALSNFLRMPLPLWIAEPKKSDAWRTVADLTAGAEAAQNTKRMAKDQDEGDPLRSGDHEF